jgi:Mg-chelatase subunit ChlD
MSTSSTGAQLSVVRSPAVEGEDDLIRVHASVSPPGSDVRASVDVVLVVDVSGSMSSEATIQTGQNSREQHGLSLLDVVKHACRTVAASLGENDRLGVVSFASQAQQELALTSMTADGQAEFEKVIESLHPKDSTNLWGGLVAGMDCLREQTDATGAAGEGQERPRAVFLLTDGLPNCAPPGGKTHLESLKQYKDEHTGFFCTVNTFGFGYSLDSKLLTELADEGKGAYAFIPDAAMVGTIFVSSLANLLATYVTGARLAVEVASGYEFVETVGGQATTKTSWGAQVDMSSIHFGQRSDVVFTLRSTKSASATEPCGSVILTGCGPEATCDIPSEPQVSDETEEAVLRGQFDNMVSAVMKVAEGSEQDAQRAVAEFLAVLKKSRSAATPAVKGMIEDVAGQVMEAAQADYFRRWGRHYLPSLQQAHRQQTCNNFKDPGVQVYGGPLFTKMRDLIEDEFLKIPPPKPSRASSTSTTLSSMSSYYSSGAPCFHGSCSIRLHDGSTKQLRNLRRGDRVWSGNTNDAVVRCVVKTLRSGTDLLCELPAGLLVTPFHPVKIGGSWRFPADLCSPKKMSCDAVYSVLLADSVGGTVEINGTEAVALGHGIRSDSVASHDYFGSYERVCRDLRRAEQAWEDGFVTLQTGCTVRDPLTQHVAGMRVTG